MVKNIPNRMHAFAALGKKWHNEGEHVKLLFGLGDIE